MAVSSSLTHPYKAGRSCWVIGYDSHSDHLPAFFYERKEIMQYTQHFSTKVTPQSEPIPGTAQVQNNAGGFAWRVTDWDRLDRFLILGSEGGTYYVGEKKLTVENANAVLRCLREHGSRTVSRIAEISQAGRAPKNDPALFALALACSPKFADVDTRREALSVLPLVARTGTHLFQFAEAVEHFRGWGRGLSDAVAAWYQEKDADALSYQAVKYQQRNGWSHRDLLRLSHPIPPTIQHGDVFRWIAKNELPDEQPDGLRPIIGYELAQRATTKEHIVNLIADYALTREMIQTQWLNEADVWAALLAKMPMTAMIRNLGKMTSVGLIAPMSDAAQFVANRLDSDVVLKARVHPLQVLVALKIYEQGHGVKGSLTWNPVARVVDALDAAFYQAFGNIESTGKRWMLALDVSGSMTWNDIVGMPGVTPRVGSAAMAMVTARSEPQHLVTAFTGGYHRGVIQPLAISPRQRLDDICEYVDHLNAGGTDCALPMIYALENRIPVDVFVVYTDNETWAGLSHPAQALNEYRQKMGIPAKLVVVGMTSTGFSIADPDDKGMLDVVGFDTAAPNMIADFAQ